MKKLSLIAFLLMSLAMPAKNASASLAPHLGFFFFLPVLGVSGQVINKPECRFVLCLDKVAAFATIYGGLLLLDEEGSTLEFSELSNESALEVGISDTERESYNESLVEINILKDEIALELSSIKSNHLEEANRLWNESAVLLDRNAYIAVEKIRSHIGKRQ